MHRQTIWTIPPLPDWPGNGSIDPYPSPEGFPEAFQSFIHDLVIQGKTDGIQYSTAMGVSIRKWADDETVLLYENFITQNYILPLGIPLESSNVIVETISQSE